MYVDVKQGFCAGSGGERRWVRQFETSLASSVEHRSARVYIFDYPIMYNIFKKVINFSEF